MTCVVVFDGVELTGPIECDDPSALRDIDTRSGNRVLPLADGTRALEPIIDELDRTLVWSVDGRFAPDGSAYADREAGVEANLEFYRALFDPRGGATGTGLYDIEVQFTATSYAGAAQVIQYGQVRNGPTTARIVTRLVITSGELLESSS